MATGLAQPGASVPSGSLVTPGGPQGIGGIQGPTGPNAVSTDAGNQAKLGSDSRIYVPAGTTFMSKTAAYTLTVADSGKEVLCSGGSWTLTLPAPAVGLTYDLRNDMGISGTTGTITVSPTGGTIDNAASLALLPQQECRIRSDGTNWRSFGLKREVILGVNDISASTASGSVLLPSGYRYFELTFNALAPATNADYLIAQLSTNGGSTWVATGYYEGVIANNSATTMAYVDAENVASFRVSANCYSSANPWGMAKLTIYPGTSTINPQWLSDSGGRSAAVSYQIKWQSYGLMTGQSAPVNALKYYFAASNIVNAFLTVKGIV